MHKSTVIPTINSITQWIRVWEAARATEKCRLRILNPHLFFCLNTHREMTNFITLPIPLSERSELKPNYHTRAKLKAFPLNGCNPSPDKWAAPLPLCYRPLFSLPAFRPLHSCQHTSFFNSTKATASIPAGHYLPHANINQKIFGIKKNKNKFVRRQLLFHRLAVIINWTSFNISTTDYVPFFLRWWQYFSFKSEILFWTIVICSLFTGDHFH